MLKIKYNRYSLEDMCIISSFYNPCDSEKRLRNYKIFLDFLRESGMEKHFYVCHIRKPEEKPLIAGGTVYEVVHAEKLFHKECGLNYVLSRLPETYRKVIAADCDMISLDVDWVGKTAALLEKYMMIQLFNNNYYANPETGVSIQYNRNSLLRGWCTGKPHTAQQGGVMAYRREYFENHGLMFDKCLVGGGDNMNVTPFLSVLSNTSLTTMYHNRYFKGLNSETDEYILKKIEYLKKHSLKPCYYLDSPIAHLYHGELKNRKYYERRLITKKYIFSDYFVKDINGFYQYIKADNPLRNEIIQYFIGRHE